MFSIKMSQEFGRGLFAESKIELGQIIFDAELLVLSQIDTVKLEDTDLKYYTFKFNEEQDCLVLGHGELFNHSETSNVAYFLIQDDGRFKMRFMAIADIEPSNQLFIDYNSDMQVNVSNYVGAPSLL